MNWLQGHLFLRLFQRKDGKTVEECFEECFAPVPKKKAADCKGCVFDGKTFGGKDQKTYCSRLRCSGGGPELEACRWRAISDINWPKVEKMFERTRAVDMLAISLDMIRKMQKKR